MNDYANALTPTQLEQLDSQLRGYEKGTTRQIAVAIFKSLDGESVEDVSIRLAEKWKIGGKASNDGVLVTLFLDDHKLRIEVGYGLEDKLTDALSSRIIREVIAPKMRENDLFGALSAGLAAIDTVVTGNKHEEGAPPAASTATTHGGGGLPIAAIIFAVIFVLIMVFTRGGFLFVLLNIFFGGGGGFSGGGGGWSSGGGGGGGFSGGGGSFGGGGSSGSW